ncbi:TonB-dependent receptor, partial [hydrothermal vent metagenome]
MKHLKQLVFNLLLLSSVAAVAEEPPEVYEESLLLLYQDEEMISIATGTAKPLHLAPSVASVITAREIKTLGARTLDEALEFVPGLHVSRDQYSQSAIFSIRGIHSNFNSQVILLINGHPINEPISGSRPPQFKLPVANISRIEVIRGPGSAVYGADAFAGVINVITKRANEINGTVFGARTGSFGRKDIWAQHGTQLAGWKAAFSFERNTTDGDNKRYIEEDLLNNSGNMNTQYELYNTSINLEKNNWNLWLNSWNLKNAGVGVGITQTLDPLGKQEANQYTAKLNYKDKKFAKNWQLESNLTYRTGDQQSRYQLFPVGTVVQLDSEGNIWTPGATSAGYAEFTNGMLGNPGGDLDHGSFETAFSYHGHNSHLVRLAFGIKYDRAVAKESKNFGPGVLDGVVLSADPNTPTPISGTLVSVTGTGNIFLPDSSRTVRHLSLQDEWQFARDWELTSGIRYDHYSDFGSTTNPRLALVWATRYNLTSKLLYGRAFRAPGFGELYYINNPTTIGNNTLNPEVLDMVELAFDYRPTYDLEMVLNLFKYRADDLIAYGADGIAQNMHNQRGHGMELDINYTATNKL